MKKSTIYALPFCILLLLVACAPVHRFTCVKKTPRAYTMNYKGSEVKAPRSDLNKEPWIVFSDREKNQTFLNPQGKVKAKDVDYLDAFLVIGKKGEYLKLIKYTPDILKNGKLQYKQAEYYGWMDKSKLLLTRQSYTDISSGKKLKTIVAFSDTLLLDKPDNYFGTDSLYTFKDPAASSLHSGVAPFSLVYRLKESATKEKALITRNPYINADQVKEAILGWIDSSLLQDIGTGLHVDFPKAAGDPMDFIIRNSGDTSLLTAEHLFENRLLSGLYPAARYSPVSIYNNKDSWTSYRVGFPLPIFDKSDNFIFNINGGRLTYSDFRRLSSDLKKINIAFVFEAGQHILNEFSRISGALQGLQSLFEETGGKYVYNFSCITSFSDADGKEAYSSTAGMDIALQPEYSAVMNFLAEKAGNQGRLKPISFNRPWSALRMAVQSFDNHADATNLIVVIGEKGFVSGGFDNDFHRQVARNNCRILAFQPYADLDNSSTNFVLDMESLITGYSDTMLGTKGDILVSPLQARRRNDYRDVSQEGGNSYRLDFPDRSITQGYILFPTKGESLPMHILPSSIDTILQQIRIDNRQVLDHIAKAFNESGNNRTKYDSLYLAGYGMDQNKQPQKKTLASFKASTPGWYIPSHKLLLPDSVHAGMDYKLLVSEAEMKELKEFTQSLSAIEADYTYQAQAKKKAGKEPCNCPDDDFLLPEHETVRTSDNDSIPPEYASTRKIRKHIYRLHIQALRNCKLCKEKKSHLKKMTLAELQQRVTGLPSFHPVLNSITAKDLSNKKKVTDKELDELIGYYKSIPAELEKAEKIESNDETWFWVDQNHLP